MPLSHHHQMTGHRASLCMKGSPIDIIHPPQNCSCHHSSRACSWREEPVAVKLGRAACAGLRGRGGAAARCQKMHATLIFCWAAAGETAPIGQAAKPPENRPRPHERSRRDSEVRHKPYEIRKTWHESSALTNCGCLPHDVNYKQNLSCCLNCSFHVRDARDPKNYAI